MSLIQDRADVQTLLEAKGLFVADDVGQTVLPPVVFIDRDNPYITRGDETTTFDSQYVVRFRLLGVTDMGTNDTVSDKFDELIMDVAAAFHGYNIDISRASAPLSVELNNTSYAGVEILIDVGTNLKEV